MTDDEAFIRAIVDRPGDDLPRLVYADWLDERGDPRGVYLRAETELMRLLETNSEGRFGRTYGFRIEPNDLNPVWVARVSRPPIGICSKRVRREDCGPSLSPDQLDLAEKQIGVTLPVTFRALLLNANGGRPHPGYFPLPEGEPSEQVYVNGFAMLGKPRQDSTRPDLLTDTLYFRRELGLPPDWLLFATADDGVADLLVSVRPDDAGRVYYWEHYDSGFTDDTVWPIADSIPEFLAGLVPNSNDD